MQKFTKERDRRQGPPFRRRRSHRRALRAAQGGGGRRGTARALAPPARRRSRGSSRRRSTFEDDDDQARAALSDRVQATTSYAFVEIPSDALDPASTGVDALLLESSRYRPLPVAGSRATVNREIVNQRFRDARRSIARSSSRLTKRVDDVGAGAARSATPSGAIKAAAAGRQGPHGRRSRSGMMMILLFSVMSGAPQLLNSVIEEKMSRISEVLIGSITPFELMMGKLVGLRRGLGAPGGDLRRRRHRRRAATTATATSIRSADIGVAAAVPADGRRSCSGRSSSRSAPRARI